MTMVTVLLLTYCWLYLFMGATDVEFVVAFSASVLRLLKLIISFILLLVRTFFFLNPFSNYPLNL